MIKREYLKKYPVGMQRIRFENGEFKLKQLLCNSEFNKRYGFKENEVFNFVFSSGIPSYYKTQEPFNG